MNHYPPRWVKPPSIALRECSAVRDALALHIPEYRANENEAACMAAFYADATPVARRFDWATSAKLVR
jgi:hypothetical protein